MRGFVCWAVVVLTTVAGLSQAALLDSRVEVEDFKISKDCSVCTHVLEQTKRGAFYLLPNICEDLRQKEGMQDKQYTTCLKVVAAFARSRDDVRFWLHSGCLKQEPYGSMEVVTPCPSHAICTQLKAADVPFCPMPVSDYKDVVATFRFAEEREGAGEAVEAAAATGTGTGEGVGSFTIAKACSVCTHVLEQTKHGAVYNLAEVCKALRASGKPDTVYTACHAVLEALANPKSQADVREWLHFGCWKQEPYNSMEKIVPCPSHAICSQLADAKTGKAFCKLPETDYKDGVGTK